MPRPPKLRQKNGYWMTKAGGCETYFGLVRDVPYKAAQELFADHLKGLGSSTGRRAAASCLEVCDRHLVWVKKHKAESTYKQRQYFLQRWCDFEVGPAGRKVPVGDRPCTRIGLEELQAFLDDLAAKGLSRTTVGGAQTAVKACWNWAAGNVGKLIPKEHRPFAGMPKVRPPLKALTEADLLNDDEVERLLNAADADLGRIRGTNGRYRRRRPDEFREGESNPYRGFRDLLQCYYHTGARTSELARIRVREVLDRSSCVVLGQHKRSETLREQRVRQIILNDAAYAVFKRHCERKKSDEYVFTQSNGSPWDKDRLDERFAKVRGLAGVRDVVTIYSFRHLWISEMLMTGQDIATVAKMAGTSIRMIEQVYGHFRSDHLAEAQRRLDEDRGRRRAANRAEPS